MLAQVHPERARRRAVKGGQEKLSVPKLRKNTIVFQTGEGLQLPSFGPLPPLDICGYMRSIPPLLDIPAFLVKQIDAKPAQVLTKTEMQGIADRCLLEVLEYAHKYEVMHPLSRYLGQNMFRAAIVSYDAQRETGLVGSFIIRVDSMGALALGNVEWHELLKADKTFDDLYYFGETEYVEQFVFKLGQRFLGPYKGLFGKTVSQTSLPDATSAALSLIIATEETAKIITPPHGIGGPIDVATITTTGVEMKRQ